MNAHKRVFLFVLLSLILYSGASYFTLAYKKKWKPFNRVNLLTDIVHKPATAHAKSASAFQPIELPPDVDPADTVLNDDTLQALSPPSADTPHATSFEKTGAKKAFSASDPLTKKDILLLTTDSNVAALSHFSNKLAALKRGEKVKVRIAYLGDSMIEGDLLSQTLRSLLQKMYGGYGVGFIPITSQVAQFRRTATASFSNGWRDLNFKNTKSKSLFLSGHVFYTSENDWVKIRDNTIRDTSVMLNKYLLYGTSTDTSDVVMQDKTIPLHGRDIFNRKLLAHDQSKSIRLSIDDQQLPLYGVSFESPTGIIVDNFSFRGISGLEFGRMSTELLNAINTQHPYDLIIFQFGVNVLYQPEETHFNWYKRAAIPVINKLKHGFPQADLLIVGTGDRAFRYDDGYQSAVGIEELIKVQAALAVQTNCAFYSLYAAMGGKNSMVNWATQSPSLANKDYVHPNALGARILGKHLFEAINKDVNKSSTN